MASKGIVQADDSQAKLKALFAKLDALLQSQQGSLRKALRLIDSILALAPGDADALKCKAVVLVQHEQFEQALEVLDAAGVGDELLFEKAYCYYRLGKLEQALETAQHVQDERRLARLQLEAQLHYRLGDYKMAIKVYRELFQVHKVESLELRTNVIAAYVCGGHADQVADVASAMHISAADSSDVGFNMACALLQLGTFSDAEQQLQLALRAGREALLEEDLGEEAAEEELAPLTAQLAFAHSELGRAQEAAEAYQRLEEVEGLDAATTAVVQNNIAAAAYAATLQGTASKKAAAEALKRLDPLLDRSSAKGPPRLAQGLEARLMDSQKAAILGNRVLLMLAAQKAEGAESALSGLAARFPAYGRLPLLQAALLAHAGKLAEADAALQGDTAQQLGLPATLMRAQLAIAGGDRPAALALLHSLPEDSLRHQPAVVATVVAIQEQEGDADGSAATLRGALDWWRSSMAASGSPAAAETEQWLLQRLVEASIAAGDHAGARRLFGELSAVGGSSGARTTEALAALAAAHGIRHEAGIEELAAGLPNLPSLDDAAVAKLENAPATSTVRRAPREEAAPASATATAPAAAGASATAQDAAARTKKRQKKRKPRFPKGYDPTNPGPRPDPERWLPKWQRSDFKKPRGKRRQQQKEAAKGSQGKGLVDESLDISKQAAPEPGTAAPILPSRQAAGKSAGGGRRKGRR